MEDHMQQSQGYTGTEFVEGFFLFAAILWVLGAVLFISFATVGANKIGHPAAPAMEQTTSGATAPTN